MYGWIETHSANVFADTDAHDVVLRTDTLAGKLVFGNDSHRVAGMYIAGNNVGVRCVPDAAQALDVRGDARLRTASTFERPWERELALSAADGLVLRMGSDADVATVVNEDGVRIGDLTQLRHDGTTLLDTAVVGRRIFKVKKELPGVRLVRVGVASVCLVGVFADQLEAPCTIELQGHVLDVQRVETLVDSLQLTLAGPPPRLAIGDAMLLRVLDPELMTLGRFGRMFADVATHELELVTDSVSSRIEDDSGRTLLEVEAELKGGDVVAFFERGGPSHVELEGDGFERPNLWRCVAARFDRESGLVSLALAMHDNATRPADAFPQLLASLVDRTSVSLRVVALQADRAHARRIAVRDVAVSFQAQRMVVDWQPALDAVFAPGAASPVLHRLDLQNGTAVLPLRTVRGAGNKLLAELVRAPRSGLAAGRVPELLVDVAGAMAVVLQTEYPADGSGARLLLDGLPPGDGDTWTTLWTHARGTSTLWSVRDSHVSIGGARELQLAFAGDAARDAHARLDAGDVVWLLGFRALASERVRCATEVAIHAPRFAVRGELEAAGEARLSAGLRIGADEATAARVCSDEDALLLEHGRRVAVAAPELELRQGCALRCGALGTVLSDAGTLSVADAVSDAYYTTVATATVPSDPTRAFGTEFDADVGEYVTYLVLPDASLPAPDALARCTDAFVDGRRFDLKPPRLQIAGADWPASWPDPGRAFDVRFCAKRDPRADYEDASSAAAFVRLKANATLGADGRSLELTVDGAASTAHLAMQLGRLVALDTAAVVRPALLRHRVANAFLVAACEPVAENAWRLSLEALAGYSDVGDALPALRFGVAIALRPLDAAPLQLARQVRATQVGFRATPDDGLVMHFVPDAGSSALRGAALNVLTLPVRDDPQGSRVGARWVRTSAWLPHADALDVGLDAGAEPAALATSAGETTLLYSVRGVACRAMHCMLIGGTGDLRLTARLPDLTQLNAPALREYVGATLFVEGRPWRVRSVRPGDADLFDVELHLSRGFPVAEVLSFAAGDTIVLLPCRSRRRDVVRAAALEAATIAVGGRHTIEARDGALVLEESLALARDATHARFTTNLHVEGTLVAEAVSHVSDRAFKTDVARRAPEADLALLRDLEVYDYKFLDRGGARAEVGVLAHELEALLPGAVQQMSGFVPNVYSRARYDGFLIVDGAHAATLQPGCRLQIAQQQAPPAAWFSVEVVSAVETDDRAATYVTLAEPLPAGHATTFFVYGTWTDYKVANTTALLMTCLNAIKALAARG